MEVEKLRSGKALVLYALVVNGKCLVRVFINGLDVASKKQVAKLLEQRADRLIIHDVRKFRPLGDGIFELKTRSNVRILCFWGGKSTLILTHGFTKPPPKVLKTELAKAIKWLKEYQTNVD
jgi:putative component of toxin-antitoxin plasmid stabilization module